MQLKPHHSNSIFDGKLRVYPTLQCNLKCPYCVNEQGEVRASRSRFRLREVEEWAEAFQRIQRDVIFTGGEPTLYPGFYRLVNLIPPSIEVTIYTNLRFDVETFIREIKRNIVLFVSYHPSYGSHLQFIEKHKRLSTIPHFKMSLHSIMWEKQRDFLQKVHADFAAANIKIKLDHDQLIGFDGCLQTFKARVRCSRRIILIAPDGTRYPCVSKMVRQVDPMENIIDQKFKEEDFSFICNDYGQCAACDALGQTTIIPELQ